MLHGKAAESKATRTAQRTSCFCNLCVRVRKDKARFGRSDWNARFEASRRQRCVVEFVGCPDCHANVPDIIGAFPPRISAQHASDDGTLNVFSDGKKVEKLILWRLALRDAP